MYAGCRHWFDVASSWKGLPNLCWGFVILFCYFLLNRPESRSPTTFQVWIILQLWFWMSKWTYGIQLWKTFNNCSCSIRGTKYAPNFFNIPAILILSVKHFQITCFSTKGLWALSNELKLYGCCRKWYLFALSTGHICCVTDGTNKTKKINTEHALDKWTDEQQRESCTGSKKRTML